MPDDIQFFGNPEAPQPPPDDVRVTDYRVMPWPDGTRVTVEMGLTQFRVFPAMDISIATPDGEVLRQISCVGALERRPAPTLHLPRLDRGAALLAVIEMLHGDSIERLRLYAKGGYAQTPLPGFWTSEDLDRPTT